MATADFVFVKLPPKIEKDAARMERLQSPLIVCDILAQQIFARVMGRGVTATPRTTQSKWERAKGAYFFRAGITTGNLRNGSEYPLTPNKMGRVDAPYKAAGAEPRKFSLTGGMNAGWRVTASGESARLRMRGSSLGTTGKNEPNESKAGRVWKMCHVNIFEPTRAEIDAIGMGMAQALGEAAARALGAENATQASGTPLPSGEFDPTQNPNPALSGANPGALVGAIRDGLRAALNR